MLIADPAALLRDEPFSALDESTRDFMNMELQRICAEQQSTAFLVTHSLAEAVIPSHRILVMKPRPGRIVEDIVIDLPRPHGRVSPIILPSPKGTWDDLVFVGAKLVACAPLFPDLAATQRTRPPPETATEGEPSGADRPAALQVPGTTQSAEPICCTGSVGVHCSLPTG
jgi:hypothetical protein